MLTICNQESKLLLNTERRNMKRGYIDRVKLLECMKDKHITITAMSEALNISRTAFYNKLYDGVDFTEREIDTLIKTFGTKIF